MRPASHLWWERLGEGPIASATTIANAVKMEKDWIYRPAIHLRRNNVFSGIRFKFVWLLPQLLSCFSSYFISRLFSSQNIAHC